MTTKAVFLSVIICTYNRAALLERCLNGLAEQQLDSNSFEVIVVDNNSTDASPELVTRYDQQIGKLKCVFERKQGLSYARNRGCAEAEGEYLVYLDDDAIAPPDYLSNIMRVIAQHSPDIMGGPVYPYYTSKKPAWFRDEYEIRKFEAQSGFSTTCRVSGGNYIIKKRILEMLGGFDTTFGMIGKKLGVGEERKVLELYREVTPEDQQKVYYSLECFVRHHVPKHKMRIAYMVRKYFLGGKTMFLINLEVKGKTGALGLRQLIKKFAKTPFDFLRCIYSEVRAQGLSNADYIGCLTLRAYHIGHAFGKLEYILRTRKKG